MGTLLELLDSGDHVIAMTIFMEEVTGFLRKSGNGLPGWNVPSSIFLTPLSWNRKSGKHTMIWVESPTNPLLKLVDLAEIARIAKRHGLITVCDNTFCSPWVQRPIDHGFDITMHSATKYLNGHSDVIGGIAVIAPEKRN